MLPDEAESAVKKEKLCIFLPGSSYDPFSSSTDPSILRPICSSVLWLSQGQNRWQCREPPLLRNELDATPPLKKAITRMATALWHRTREVAALLDKIRTPKKPIEEPATDVKLIPTPEKPEETLKRTAVAGGVGWGSDGWPRIRWRRAQHWHRGWAEPRQAQVGGQAAREVKIHVPRCDFGFCFTVRNRAAFHRIAAARSTASATSSCFGVASPSAPVAPFVSIGFRRIMFASMPHLQSLAWWANMLASTFTLRILKSLLLVPPQCRLMRWRRILNIPAWSWHFLLRGLRMICYLMLPLLIAHPRTFLDGATKTR